MKIEIKFDKLALNNIQPNFDYSYNDLVKCTSKCIIDNLISQWHNSRKIIFH